MNDHSIGSLADPGSYGSQFSGHRRNPVTFLHAQLVCSCDHGLSLGHCGGHAEDGKLIDGLRNQIEGNVIQGASRALMEEVDFDANGVKNLNWVSYPIIRFREVPDVEIVLINQPQMAPMGGGEASSIATGAAIANAIFDAVGARLRRAPFTPARVLQAIRAV